jgi:hypothetical protein
MAHPSRPQPQEHKRNMILEQENLSVLWPICQRAYTLARSLHHEAAGKPWPKRRVKRKPLPGLYEVSDDSEG